MYALSLNSSIPKQQWTILKMLIDITAKLSILPLEEDWSVHSDDEEKQAF